MASKHDPQHNGLDPRKLFIVHAADDMGIIKPRIIDVLEKEYNIPCIVAERDFHCGKGTISCILDAIKTSYKTVVILTDKSINSNWVKYETLVALERSQRLKVLSVTVLLFNIDVEDKNLLFGVLSNAMTVRVDLNRENWKDNMVEKIQRQIPMAETLVMTNLATGQAWSHFTGYCNVVFPHLRQRITSSQWYKDNPGRFPVLEFNLIPHSAKTCGKLQELDGRIKYQGDLEKIIVHRGSYPTRPYVVPVYSIMDPITKKEIFFVCQIPNTVSILNKAEKGCNELLEESAVTNDRNAAVIKISSGERNLQVARFYYILNRLLNHPKNKECNGLVKLLLYDDTKEKPGDVLLRSLREEMRKKSVGSTFETTQQDVHSIEEAVINTERDRTVFIACDENESDCSFKRDLEKDLIRNNFKVWEGDCAGVSFCDNLERAIAHSKWSIFLLSKESIHSGKFPVLNFQWRNILHKNIDKNENLVIPILDGIGANELLYELGWVTYLNRHDDNLKERLLQTLRLESLPIESTVPATDVHQGLAWAYVMNYLSLVLDEHLEKMNTIQQQNPDQLVYKKMFIVVPSSCFIRSLDRNENGYLLDPRFESEKEEHFLSKNVAGVPSRKYQLHLFRLKGPTQEFIVPVEFPNAVLCLHEMASLGELSGLSRKELHHEAWAFSYLTQRILDVSKCKGKAILIYFDDEQMNVADAILQTLEYEENIQI